MTLNIWGEYFGNPVPERIDDMENTIRKYDADILGIQEVCRIWYGSNFLERLSNKYIAILPFRGNYTVLLFKKDMFSVWEQGFKMYENGIVSAYEVAEEFSEVSSHHGDPVRNPDGTWTGKRTENDKTKSLDHIVIFKDDIKIKKHHVVEDQEIINVTDHSPVYIDFDF